MHQRGHVGRVVWAVVLTLSAGVVFAPNRTRADDPKPPRERVFVGYLFGSTEGVEFGLYTHVCHAFLVPNEDGQVRPRAGVPGRALAERAHKAGVKLLVSLGGWGWDRQFAAIVAKPEAEDRYVKRVIELVDESDYDGIDLDWEYPDTKEEAAGFGRLVRRLRKDLDAVGQRKSRPMLLTMAASANPGTLRWLDRDALLETMDWINVMTYDYAGEWTNYAGHHSPLFASSKAPKGAAPSIEKTMRYLVDGRKIPPDRLALGIPLYGKGFAVSEPYASTKDTPKRRLPASNFNDLDRLRREGKWTRLWDDETKTPWLVAPDLTVVVGYDDVESVGLKTEWALKQGFRGVFFWQVAADRMPDGSHPLQHASRRVLDGAARPAP